MAGVIWTEDWASYLNNGVEDLSGDADWILTGSPGYVSTDADFDQTFRVRKTATLDRFTDLTGLIDATNNELEFSVDMITDGLETEEGDAGTLSYTLNEGANWTLVTTLTATDTSVTNTGFTLDTTSWSAAQTSGFGVRFEGNGSHWNDNVFQDNMTLQAIPEPATLGLFTLIGGGILFIRRRFTF